MQSFELTQPISSAILLKQFESRFGQTMNLEGLDKSQLEDLANGVRTKIHTITDNLHFGKELKDNEGGLQRQNKCTSHVTVHFLLKSSFLFLELRNPCQ